VNKEIRMEEWDRYFRGLLGGSERKGRRGGGRLGEREGEEWEGEEEMGFEEVERAIGKLKKGKAAGEDGIQNEAWLWGGQGVRKAIGEICRRVWGGGGFPERWKA